MSTTHLYVALLLPPLFLSLLFKSLRARPEASSSGKHLPPSPPRSLPILGHLLLLKKPLHRTLARLSQLHGPILLLRFGSRPVLHVSSLPAALHCFTTLDLTFASRPLVSAGKILGYDHTTMASAPYGPHWRNLRRISAVELFSTHRLDALSRIRAEEVAALANHLAVEVGEDGRLGKVEMRPMIFGLIMNVMMRMVIGKRCYGEGKEEAEGLMEIVEEMFRASGETNIGDFVPLLRWVGVLGVERRMRSLRARTEVFLKVVVEGRKRELEDERCRGVEEEEEEGVRRTILDVMLSLQKEDPEYYTDDIIKGIVITILSAGTDTTATTIEWAMSALLNHPRALLTAQAEIDKVVPTGEMVNELHLQRLPYLQAIISETLRLYPAGPLLVAHESSEDCMVEGFHIPRGTILLVNAWAIHRDETKWEDSTTFKPERFLRNDVSDIIRTIPFGLGRRSCPGEGLARRMVGLTLATLIQCFEWERVGGEEVDMKEGSGLTMPKETPLEAMCKARVK